MLKLPEERMDYLASELKKYDEDSNAKVHEKALHELSEKIKIISNDVIEKGNTIAYRTERIKTADSFIRKQNRNKNKGLNIDYEDMHDIIGARIICLTLSDVKEFIKEVQSSKEFNKILEERDYINNPKKSGYKSYHILVGYPITVGSKVYDIKAEIQIRTIFMDVFAREEHKINYKGDCSEEDKIKLSNLSKKLAYYDWSLDNQFKVKNLVATPESEKELSSYRNEFEKVEYIFSMVYNYIKPLIKKSIEEFELKDDVLHFVHGIKSLNSIKRKMIKRHLECTADNMLHSLRDVVRYKVVCTDENTAKKYIEFLTKKLKENDFIANIETSDHLDIPKESGYRGYKINASYNMPFVTGSAITIEILIRTMIMDAWALHNDKIFNDEEARNKYKEPFSGLSESLHDAETTIEIIKESNKNNRLIEDNDLLEQVRDYIKLKEEPPGGTPGSPSGANPLVLKME